MRRFGEETWATILRTVRSSGAEVTVLSSEHFFYLDRHEVMRLRDTAGRGVLPHHRRGLRALPA